MIVRSLAFAVVLAGAAPLLPLPASAAPAAPLVEMQDPVAACRRALPAAGRFIGQSGTVAKRRFRAPRGVVVRACYVCTRDFRQHRLTFGLDPGGIVRSVACN